MTITKRLKTSIINGAKKGISYDRAEIKLLIKEESGMCFGVDYQESHLAGSIAALTKKGILVSKERGIYELVMDEEISESDNEERISGENIQIENFDVEVEEDNGLKRVKGLVEESIKEEREYLKEITSDLKISIKTVNRKDLDNIMKIKELVEYLERFQLS